MSRKDWIKPLIILVATPALLACALFSNLYFRQESIIFPATRLPPDHQFEFHLPFDEITIPVDGANINALYFQQENPRGLIFFLHGNAGNLDSWTTNIDYYRRVNYDLFILDYRGYGTSTGSIESEQQLHADVRVAWNRIAPDYAEKPIVIYGRSLGAALAARLAADVDPELLVLVTPFRSMLAMAELHYPIAPEWLLRYPLRTDKLIADIRSRTLFVHGDQDLIIPLSHSYDLRELATADTELLVIEGANHNNLHHFDSYLDGLTAELPD